MNKTSNSIRIICEVGIFAAIGYVLDELQGIISKGLFINGGSIGFAMIAVLIIAYRRGWLPAILTGLIIGGLDLATSASILHPAQLLLDYVLPYAVVGFAGFLKPLFDGAPRKSAKILWIAIGTLLGGLLKFLSHYAAGVIFWANPEWFAWGLNNMSPYLYCFIYNFAFIGPSILLTAGLWIAIFLRAPRIISVNPRTSNTATQELQNTKPDIFSWVFQSLIIAGGSFCLTFYLIKYIKSYANYSEAGIIEYEFDPNCMLIFVLGLFLVITGVISLISLAYKSYDEKISLGVITTIFASSLIFGIARLTKMYVKGKDPTIYWIWFGVGLASLIAIIAILMIRLKLKNKKMDD